MKSNQSFVIKWLALFLVGAALVSAPGKSKPNSTATTADANLPVPTPPTGVTPGHETGL